MIERPDRGSFAGAWVFPGGKLEPDDGDRRRRGGDRPPGGRPRDLGRDGPRAWMPMPSYRSRAGIRRPGTAAAHPHVVLPRARPGRRARARARRGHRRRVGASRGHARPPRPRARSRCTRRPGSPCTTSQSSRTPGRCSTSRASAGSAGSRRSRGAARADRCCSGTATPPTTGSKTPMRTRGMRHPATVSSSRACRGCTPARDRTSAGRGVQQAPQVGADRVRLDQESVVTEVAREHDSTPRRGSCGCCARCGAGLRRGRVGRCRCRARASSRSPARARPRLRPDRGRRRASSSPRRG